MCGISSTSQQCCKYLLPHFQECGTWGRGERPVPICLLLCCIASTEYSHHWLQPHGSSLAWWFRGHLWSLLQQLHCSLAFFPACWWATSGCQSWSMLRFRLWHPTDPSMPWFGDEASPNWLWGILHRKCSPVAGELWGRGGLSHVFSCYPCNNWRFAPISFTFTCLPQTSFFPPLFF